jgi:hypothetical protein
VLDESARKAARTRFPAGSALRGIIREYQKYDFHFSGRRKSPCRRARRPAIETRRANPGRFADRDSIEKAAAAMSYAVA